MPKQSSLEWSKERAAKIVAKFPQIESQVLHPFLRKEITIALLEALGLDKQITAKGKRHAE